MRVMKHMRGSVLPVAVVVSVVILTGMLGLLALWEQQAQAFARSCRLRQARADVESAFVLYRLYPRYADSARFRLYDSLPSSLIRMRVRPWGLYRVVSVSTGDSLAHSCRIYGREPDNEKTLFYADNRSALTLAGRTVLRGKLSLPENGLAYGRVQADFFSGPEVPRTAICKAAAAIPAPDAAAAIYTARLFAEAAEVSVAALPDSLRRSFGDSTARLRVADAVLYDRYLSGNIVLYADELRIDASCRIGHLLVCARKVTVGEKARITAQIFARDTVLVEAGARLEYPSGIYAQGYAQVGDGAQIDGYAIVRDTLRRKKMTANYRQSRTARVRGLVWVDGVAQIQGMISGQLCVRQAVYFSAQGYYKDMLYEATLLQNPLTAQPFWLPDALLRKEVVCAD